MAVPAFHITNDDSGNFGTTSPFDETGPGTLLMDADAFLISVSSTIQMGGGPWTATINGKVASADFSGTDSGEWAVTMGTNASFTPGSSLIVGATGEITGFDGVLGFSPINVTNLGSIVATGSVAISEGLDGDCIIKNSGTITSGNRGILFSSIQGGGTHTIVNSGSLEALAAIENLSATGIEHVTNSGKIVGTINLGGGEDSINNSGTVGDCYLGDGNDSFTNTGTMTGVVDFGTGNDKFTNGGFISAFVDLGEGNDVFTNFTKVKVKGKIVQKDGFVTEVITGSGDDIFNGGNKAETVYDGGGADSYKLGGGNDTYVSIVYAPGAGIPDGGQDFVDAGSGRDSYDGSYGADVINLDNKAHDGFAANLALVLTDQSLNEHIFNFEDANGHSGDNHIYGTAGANRLDGRFGNDHLFGLAGDDDLDGGAGDDHLYGGAGRDIMTGHDNVDFGGIGQSADRFHFLSMSDSGVTAKTRDVITDFDNTASAGRDIIDLSAIDAIIGTPTNDDFSFIGLEKWHHVAGELRYVWTATQTFVEADVNGDAKADFSIALDGHHTLSAADFTGVV